MYGARSGTGPCRPGPRAEQPGALADLLQVSYRPGQLGLDDRGLAARTGRLGREHAQPAGGSVLGPRRHRLVHSPSAPRGSTPATLPGPHRRPPPHTEQPQPAPSADPEDAAPHRYPRSGPAPLAGLALPRAPHRTPGPPGPADPDKRVNLGKCLGHDGLEPGVHVVDRHQHRTGLGGQRFAQTLPGLGPPPPGRTTTPTHRNRRQLRRPPTQSSLPDPRDTAHECHLPHRPAGRSATPTTAAAARRRGQSSAPQSPTSRAPRSSSRIPAPAVRHRTRSQRTRAPAPPDL